MFRRVDHANEWHAFCEASYRGETLRYHRHCIRQIVEGCASWRRVLQQFHSVKVLQAGGIFPIAQVFHQGLGEVPLDLKPVLEEFQQRT